MKCTHHELVDLTRTKCDITDILTGGSTTYKAFFADLLRSRCPIFTRREDELVSVVTVEQISLLTFCMSSGISELLMTGALLSDILFHCETKIGFNK